jgi:hypothetical protein
MEDLQEAKSIIFESKDNTKLPKGAVIIKKSVNVTVKEIDNGFIVKKSYDIKYKVKEQIDWLYVTKEIYTKDNPIQIKEDKSLADYFE